MYGVLYEESPKGNDFACRQTFVWLPAATPNFNALLRATEFVCFVGVAPFTI
jgi:hypothetical protein